MQRCETCGRLLATLNHDHPIQCFLAATFAAGTLKALPRVIPAPFGVKRIQIVEGGLNDPFNDQEIQIVARVA